MFNLNDRINAWIFSILGFVGLEIKWNICKVFSFASRFIEPKPSSEMCDTSNISDNGEMKWKNKIQTLIGTFSQTNISRLRRKYDVNLFSTDNIKTISSKYKILYI